MLGQSLAVTMQLDSCRSGREIQVEGSCEAESGEFASGEREGGDRDRKPFTMESSRDSRLEILAPMMMPGVSDTDNYPSHRAL